MSIATFSPNKGYASFSTLVYPTITPTAIVVTSATEPVAITAAQLLNGLLIVDCQDEGAITLPSAASVVDAINGAQADNSFTIHIRNTGDEDLTVAEGVGVTVSGTEVVTQLYGKSFLIVLDAVTAGAEAYTAYSLGEAAY